MGRTKSRRALQLAVGMLLTLGLAATAPAIYLDEEQNVSLRARIYSQASVRLEDSQEDTVPTTKAGQLIQHRNFYNPELDAKFTPHTSWMKGTFLDWLAPDDLSGRLAAWGFYDGIYDYGSRQFHGQVQLLNSTFNDFKARPRRAWFLEGPTFNCPRRTGGQFPTCIQKNGNGFDDVEGLFPGVEVTNPHDIYASQNRINELYLSYTKGPVFFRVGRQGISWGESDTIALLDQNNPFDVTLAAPGVFEDLDESRIPLWTVRSSLTLFETLGPMSSGFIEAYWVPGDLDVNTGILPVLTVSPYSVRGNDPQAQVPNLVQAQFVLFDHVPEKRFESSRWGVRVQTVLARDYTVSAFFYTHYPAAPVPRTLGLGLVGRNRISTIETVHNLTSTVGITNTFFLEPLDGIVRMQASYFNREPAFIPEVNLNIAKNDRGSLEPFTKPGRVPRADFVRWELGFDRFFFVRPLNPTNSFVLVSAIVGSWNLDETSQKDFRFSGQRKPGTEGTAPEDFVQLKKVEAFAQVHLQTDYMHGRLSPGITYVQNLRGTWGLLPSLTYRWTDWLLFRLDYINIGGEYQQLGFFRDRSQVDLRVTYQLN